VIVGRVFVRVWVVLLKYRNQKKKNGREEKKEEMKTGGRGMGP